MNPSLPRMRRGKARRTTYWLLTAAYVLCLFISLPILFAEAISGSSLAAKEYGAPILVFCTVLLVCGIGVLVLYLFLVRYSSILRGFDAQERGVLTEWLWCYDPLGKRLGRTHCHRCNYERGAAMVCPECGTERIDPLPESTEP